MYKRVIVLFLMIGSSIIFLPAESKAAVVNEPANVINTATPGATLFLQRSRNRRWRNGRWWNRNRWNNRRDRHRDRRSNRRENRRDRREDRRDRREDRRDRRN